MEGQCTCVSYDINSEGQDESLACVPTFDACSTWFPPEKWPASCIGGSRPSRVGSRFDSPGICQNGRNVRSKKTTVPSCPSRGCLGVWCGSHPVTQFLMPGDKYLDDGRYMYSAA